MDRVTRHSFSFGFHYDAANLGFGPMVCHNDDVLGPGAGYPTHPHRDLEIVTWVLSGALVHTDDAGNHRVLTPGDVQVTSAGDGIMHSEIADLASGETRFVQAWVTPDAPGGTPAWHAEHLPPSPGAGLVEVAGGTAGLRLGRAGARLEVARFEAGERLQLPPGVRQHVFAARGSLTLEGTEMAEGDALRIEGAGGSDLVTTSSGEVLVWTFDD